MLTEAMTDALLEIFEERWHAIITEYLSSMGDHLADIGELLPSDANRIIEMRRMGVTMERIRKQIAHAAQQSEEDVIRAMQAIAKSDAAFAERIFGSKLTASGRSALKRVLEAQARVTFGEMENLSRTTVLSDGYRRAVDKAVQAVQGGVSDYRSAIRRTVEEAAAEGLRVEYPTKTPSGRNRSMRLDSAVRMNVLDGVRAMNRAAMEQIGEEYGADGIEISAHALCATDHLPYQGLQYSKEEFEELQQSLGRPIGAWNCKHMTWPIILGVSECTYSKEELAEMNRLSSEEIEIDGRTKTRYEWSQEQRRIETAVRYQKDRANLARHSGHDDIRRDAQAKINKLTKAYEGISEKARLGAEWDRMRVAGFRSVKVEPLTTKAGNGRINTKKNDAVPVPMDAARYQRMKSGLEKNGIVVLEAKGDDLRYLQHGIGAEATYSNGYIMHVGAVPSASAMFEETIHAKQAKIYGELSSTDDIELCAREIAANRMLQKNGKAYGFSKVDVEDIDRNLQYWENRYERSAGKKYDERDCYRGIRHHNGKNT